MLKNQDRIIIIATHNPVIWEKADEVVKLNQSMAEEWQDLLYYLLQLAIHEVRANEEKRLCQTKIFKIYHQKLVHDTASFLDIQK